MTHLQLLRQPDNYSICSLTLSPGTNTCQIKRIKFALPAPDCCKTTTKLRNLTFTSNGSDSLFYGFHAVRISSQVGGRTTESVLHSSVKNWRSIKSSLHLQLLRLPVPPCGLHPSSFEQVCLQLPAFLAGPQAGLTNTERTQMFCFAHIRMLTCPQGQFLHGSFRKSWSSCSSAFIYNMKELA